MARYFPNTSRSQNPEPTEPPTSVCGAAKSGDGGTSRRCFHIGNTTLRASIIYRAGPGARQLQLKTEILKISRTLAGARFIRSPRKGGAGDRAGGDFVSRRNANSPRNNDILTGISMELINTSGNRRLRRREIERGGRAPAGFSPGDDGPAERYRTLAVWR